jgi:hypothetical protein
VSFLPDEEARLLETRHDPDEAGRWRLLPVGVSTRSRPGSTGIRLETQMLGLADSCIGWAGSKTI